MIQKQTATQGIQQSAYHHLFLEILNGHPIAIGLAANLCKQISLKEVY